MARILTQDDSAPITIPETDLPKVLDPDRDVTYTIRLLSDKQYREIERRHTKRRPNHQGQMIETTDAIEVGRDVLDFVLVGWTGIVARNSDGDLVPVDCTRDAKVGLDPQVRGAIVDYATSNQRAEAAARRESFRGPA